MVANECGRVQRKAVATTSDHIRATPDVCGFSVWDLFYNILLEPRILRWLRLFWKVCAPLVREPFYTTTSAGRARSEPDGTR